MMTENASHGILNINLERCILKRSYKKRCDIIEMIGEKIHDLTVIGYAGKGKYRGSRWECLCVCGNKCIVPGGHLRANMRKSCGCRSQLRISETGINRLFSLYKRKALLRKIGFNLTKENFQKLVLSNCFYCGVIPSQRLKRLKTDNLQILYNGIDRINSSLNYDMDNCVASCRYCNQSKSNLSLRDWKEYLKRLFNHMGITDGNR